MGPLFGSPLLLVEGDDDYRIWGQVPRHHVVSIAVIPCGGSDEVKRYQAKLEQIFGSLSEPHEHPIGFALLDGDKQIPTPSSNNPQRHVRFIGLACRESENLYLTDEVLSALGHTWETACTAIEGLRDRLSDEKSSALCHVIQDRKNSDIKGLIEIISQELDTRKIPWTVRVSSVIGKNRPSGSLAQYLGSSLVDALWPPTAEVISAD
jgi:hypothetical protein